MAEVRFHGDVSMVEPLNFIRGFEMQERKGAVPAGGRWRT